MSVSWCPNGWLQILGTHVQCQTVHGGDSNALPERQRNVTRNSPALTVHLGVTFTIVGLEKLAFKADQLFLAADNRSAARAHGHGDDQQQEAGTDDRQTGKQ